MVSPRPAIDLTQPIPNGPFQSNEKYYVESPQGHLPVGQGLDVDPETGEIFAD